MDNIKKLKHIISDENITEDEFIKNIGKFIDLSASLILVNEIDFAIELLKKHKNKINIQGNKCLYHYYFSVAYNEKHKMEIANTEKDWSWEQETIENELQNLRLAYEQINDKTPNEIKSNILTNLANRFNNIGRFINAHDFWNKAIETEKTSGMPLINKGNALMYYGLNYIIEPIYQYAYLQLGYQYLKNGLQKNIYSDIEHEVIQKIKSIENNYKKVLNYKFELSDFKNSEIKDTEYATWIIDNELFLNPLSNVNKQLKSSKDDLKINSIIDTKLTNLFEDIIDKYKYSRYQFYDSLNNDKVLSKQKKQSAFSIAYSIFDKIAYFINYAFDIKIKNHRVAFKRLWYNKTEKKAGINSKFLESNNLMLRAIFWVGKDLYINENGFKNLIEPKAKEIDTMRNYIEHKAFLFGQRQQDDFTFIIPETEFNENYLRLLKLVRESIIYLSYSIKQTK